MSRFSVHIFFNCQDERMLGEFRHHIKNACRQFNVIAKNHLIKPFIDSQRNYALKQEETFLPYLGGAHDLMAQIFQFKPRRPFKAYAGKAAVGSMNLRINTTGLECLKKYV